MPPEPTQTRAIFINYRRDDAGGEAGRLFDDLTRAFSEDTVFMDVSGIEPGKDFRKSIDENVAACGVLLAVIGPLWLTIADPTGTRRLDSPNDFVRLEIASALARSIPVIPVLVRNASMPHAEALPEALQDLAYRNAVELTLPRWNSDVALLVAALRKYVHVTPATAAEPVHATIPVRLPPPIPTPPPRSKPSLNLIFGPIAAAIIIAVLILIALTVALYEYGKNLPSAPAPTTQNQPQVSPANQSPVPAQPSTQPQLQPSARTQAGPQSTHGAPAPTPVPTLRQPEEPSQNTPAPQYGAHGLNQYRVEVRYNVTGIYDDGRVFLPYLGIDSAGHAFHPFAGLITPGTNEMILSDGTNFTLGPVNDKDVLRCTLFRQDLELPPQSYSAIHMLALSTHGPQLVQPFTLRYHQTDFQEEKVEFTQSISDWTADQALRFPGERLAILQPYVNTAAGTPQPGRFAVYEYTIRLNPNAPLRTLTLPHNENLVVLAVTLVP